MSEEPAAIPEFPVADADAIRREVFAGGTPVVLRGLVSHWPSVAHAQRSGYELIAYLRRLDNGQAVEAIMTPPEAHGRIFYNDSFTGFNFVRNRLPVSAIAEQLLRYMRFRQPPAVAVQSALLRDCLPQFATENPFELPGPGALPRLWLGNAITTPTHLDEWNNIGCVVCGRRRFTLFPPEQLVNLYVGPLDFAPTGAPMSLVKLHAPDFGRFPKFRAALAAAMRAELGPGDAIFIPPLWWHHVESLEPFNLLVNYWWHAAGGAAIGAASGFDALLHAMMNLRTLPAPARAAWRALFEQYVFGAGPELTAHLPAAKLGVLGALSPEDIARLRSELSQRLQKRG